ncbi:MAG: glutaredoxin family protein [Alkalicoccus sp.]|nr:MAG: glutaredoxin family protein [Alkalicoccus sp.]
MTTLYTIDGCSVCAEVRQHLKRQEISFQEINILLTPEVQQELKKLTGEVYVPVLKSDQGIYRGLEILNFSLQTSSSHNE